MSLSIVLRQHLEIKKQYPDVLLMFRIGDFYEMFGGDAEKAAQALQITLTSREYVGDERIPMCGVPFHAIDRYVARLIAAGYRVALCDQIEKPVKSEKTTRVVAEEN